MWGYADVGADIYAALGLVIAAAQGMAPLAFALAGLVYVMIGLTFTELASSYPVAGGGHYYSLRGLGDFWGFVARLRCCLTTPLTLPCLRWRLLATSIFGLGTLPHAY
jgi:amino acid transporter